MKRYAHEYEKLPAKKRIKQEVIDIIKDRDNKFWFALESLRELLQPLDEALRMSEDSNSHLGHVLSRWMVMAEHLKMKASFDPELDQFMSMPTDSESRGFAQRYKRQVSPLHIAAYYLDPETRIKPIPENFDTQLQVFFRQYTTSDADYQTINYEFESFRAQEPPFEPGRRCWTIAGKPKLFWHSAMSHTKLLGKLGYRVFSTPCNSVASERAFSTQNLIHTKSRNHLKSETVNKLTYLYTNARFLDQFEDLQELPESIKAKSVHCMTSEEEVVLENILLGIEVEDQGDLNDIVDAGDENDSEDVEEDAGEEDEEDEF